MFKVGDRVKCVRVDPWGHLKLGETYTIGKVDEDGLVRIRDYWWEASRFVLEQPFKVGDRVRPKPREDCPTAHLPPLYTSTMADHAGQVFEVETITVSGQIQDSRCYTWRPEWLELVAEPESAPLADQTHHADAGKPRLSLIPSRGLLGCMPALEEGARKYGDRTYLEVPNGPERYAESIFRHAEKLRQSLQDHGVKGLLGTEESGVAHLAYLAADCLILLDLLAREPQDEEEDEE